MNEKIVSAIITATATVFAAILSMSVSQNVVHTIIIVVGSVICVLMFLIFRSIDKNNKYQKNFEGINNLYNKLQKDFNDLENKNNSLKNDFDSLRNEKDYLQTEYSKIEDKYNECNATILEINKYLERSHITIPSIIKSTINEHHYLSKTPSLEFEQISCDVSVIKNPSSELYDTRFKWLYEGHRELSCTTFLADVFSTTDFTDEFEKSLLIKYYSNRNWHILRNSKGYSLQVNGKQNHKTISIDMTTISAENFKISIEYILKENYDFNCPEETFVFMPFIYSNARNKKFICNIDIGDTTNSDTAIRIDSPQEEELHYKTNQENHRVFYLEKEYKNSSDFKNVTINIIHNN